MTMTETSQDAPTRHASSEKRISVWLFLLIVVATAFWVRPIGPQEASRLALTAALVDDGTVVLDDYEHVLQIDRAVRDGHIYSDKAPGQPFLAVPFYALYRVAGGEPLADASLVGVHVAQWWLTLWFAAIPLGVLAVLVYRYLASTFTRALAPTLVLVGGTILLPFGSMLFGHVLAAVLLFVAFFLGYHRRGSLLPVGVLLGLAVVVEYTAAIGVVVLLALLVYERRGEALWLLPGGALMAGLLMLYNAVAFGHPLVLSYQYTAFTAVTETARQPLAMFSAVRLDNLFDLLFSPRGFLIASPVVLVAVAGLAWLIGDRDRRLSAITCLTMVGAFFMLPMFWGNPWGGMSPGPRYMTPALPFLAVGIAAMWTRFRLATFTVGAVSVFTMVAALVTEPRILPTAEGALGFWVRSILAGDLALTVFSFVITREVALVLLLLVTTGVGVVLAKASRSRTHVLH